MSIRGTLLAMACSSAILLAQTDDCGPDPYTQGERQALKDAGYIGLGPFEIGRYHGSEDVERLLAGTSMRWIETQHFKIGSSLAAYRVPNDRAQRQKLEGELQRLQTRLPAVDPQARVLDPWLRTHLFAQRCEEVYTDFRDRLGMTDHDFPERPRNAALDDSFTGIGPHLGQREKYVVLLFDSATDAGRYAEEYLGQKIRWPQRFNLGRRDSLLFVTSPQFAGWLPDDTAMHVHVVYDVIHLLCDGFRHFGHQTPVWFKSGLAQWYGRQIDPRYPNFDRPPNSTSRSSTNWKWEPIAKRLARTGKFTPSAEMAGWQDFENFRFEDFVVAHSRVEFLLAKGGDEGLARFLFRFKSPLTLGSDPKWEDVLAMQRAALREGYGYDDWEALDADWRAWVLEVD